MKQPYAYSIALTIIAGIGATVLTVTGAEGQATRPRLPGTVVQPPVKPPAPTTATQANPAAVGFPKKRLQVGLVDWQFRPDAGKNPGLKDLGPDDAVIVYTAEDALRMSPGVKPSFEFYAVEMPRVRWVGTPAVNPQGAAIIEFRPDPKAGYTLYKAFTVHVEWLPEGQAVRVTSPDSPGTYVLHADFIDSESKAWYFGKAVFRLKAVGS